VTLHYRFGIIVKPIMIPRIINIKRTPAQILRSAICPLFAKQREHSNTMTGEAGINLSLVVASNSY